MPTYDHGDHIKVEFEHEETGESEWMWVKVDYCDDERRVVFGSLDSIPLLEHGPKVQLGSRLAVSYDKVREHRKFTGP